jgi:hypothetical protein
MAQAADGAQPQEGAPDAEGEQRGAALSRGLSGGGEAVLSASGRGAGASQGTSWVHDCWELATDMNSGQQYYFNRASGTSQWHPPPGWGPSPLAPPSEPQMQGCAGPPAAAPAEAAAAADPGEAGGAQQAQHPQQEEGGSYEPGYYYRDAFGQLQGPFDLDQLREWRGMLAMDLPILRLGLPAGSSDAKDGTPGSDGGSEAAAGAAPSAPATAAGSWSQSDLADLLGDDELLAHWRMQNPEQASHCPAVCMWPGEQAMHAGLQAMHVGLITLVVPVLHFPLLSCRPPGPELHPQRQRTKLSANVAPHTRWQRRCCSACLHTMRRCRWLAWRRCLASRSRRSWSGAGLRWWTTAPRHIEWQPGGASRRLGQR